MRFISLLLLMAASAAMAAPRHSNKPDDPSPWTTQATSATYRAECGTCHIAFPPALMIADDWLAITSDLEHHFGENAAIDAKHREEIRDFLQQNAATNRKYASLEEDLPRITTAPWFLEKHKGASRVVKKGRVKSLLLCTACHKGPEIERMMAP